MLERRFAVGIVIGLAIFAVGIAVVVLVGRGTDAAVDAAHRGFSGKKMDDALAVVSNPLEIVAPVPASVALVAVIARVGAGASPGVALGSVYVKERSANGVTFALGSRIADSFVATVEIVDGLDGCSGSLEFQSWTMDGRSVSGYSEVLRLVESIRGGLAAHGGTLGGTRSHVPSSTPVRADAARAEPREAAATPRWDLSRCQLCGEALAAGLSIQEHMRVAHATAAPAATPVAATPPPPAPVVRPMPPPPYVPPNPAPVPEISNVCGLCRVPITDMAMNQHFRQFHSA